MKSTMTFRLAILAVAMTGLMIACKKSSSSANNAGDASNVSTSADDQTMVTSETENLANDGDLALTSSNGTNVNALRRAFQVVNNGVIPGPHPNGAGSVNDSLICDASVAIDTVSNPRTVTITYNGLNCWGNRTRTGTVVISMAQGTYWSNAGAVVNMTIQNLVITRVSDGKHITVNGTKTMTNVSGGNLANLAALPSITHTVTDSISVLFGDSATRVWQTAKQRVFTYSNGLVITTTGTKTIGNYIGVEAWGINRYGVGFTSVISHPIIIQQSCNFRATSGQAIIYRTDNVTSTITLGLDALGAPAACPGLGVYYFEIVWTFPNGRTVPIILPY